MTTESGIKKIDKKQFALTKLDFKKGPNKKPLVTIGFDHGNGWLKGRSSEGIEVLLPAVYALPTDAGIKHPDEQLVGTDKTLLFKSLSDPHPEIEYYVLGDVVKEAKKPMPTYKAQKRYEEPDYTRVTQFMLSILIGDTFESGDVDVVLVLGVPSKHRTEKNVQTLIKNFERTHVVEKNGQKVKINVLKVFIQTQPMGSYFNLIFDDKANMYKTTMNGKTSLGDLNTKYLGIIDFGNYTVDLEAIKNRKPDGEERDTLTGYGMKELYNHIKDLVNDEFDTDYTAKTIEPCVNEHFFFQDGALTKDCSTDVDVYLQQQARALLKEIDNSWANRQKMQNLFIVGGGASLYAPYLKGLDSRFMLITNPQMSNAYGFHKFAQIKAALLYGKK